MINNSHLIQKLSFSNDKLFNITSYCVVNYKVNYKKAVRNISRNLMRFSNLKKVSWSQQFNKSI